MSDAARVGSSLEAVYSGAKGAVISFTKTLARETARSEVTANAICQAGFITGQTLSASGGLTMA